MENFKRSLKRLLIRLIILSLVVVCGALAIAQAQKDRVSETKAPDLETPPALIEAAPASFAPLNAVPDPESQPKWKDRETLQQDPVRFVEDSFVGDGFVQPAQAIAQVNSFQDPPVSEQSATVNAVGDRFNNAARADRFSQGDLKPPDLINASEIAAVDPNDGGQNLETNLPLLDQTPADGFPPALVEQPVAAETTASNSPRNDRFGTPATHENPIRQGFDETSSEGPLPAPIAYDTPKVDAADGLRKDLFNGKSSFQAGPNYAAPVQLDSTNDSQVTLSGAGKPGPRELEGPQTPSLTIRKIAPKNVRVGTPATFEVQVRNNGQVPVERILIRDEVPQGTQLINTNPQATPGSDGGVLWEIGTLRPGEDVTVSMQVTPLEEGPIGSVASITFQALASAQAEVKKPMLRIEHSTKRQVLVGETVNFEIVLENPGSASADKVIIEEDVPAGLSHAKGQKLEYEVGSIPAGATRRLELSVQAAEPGIVENVIRARGARGLVAEHRTTFEVIAPQLQVKIKGPNRRYLEREVEFTLAIENAGTAPANKVELVATMPRRLKFVSTNNSGRYDQATNTIRWSLDQLPPQRFGEVKFTAIPTNTGELSINAQATADRGLHTSTDHKLVVNGIAALLIEVVDQVDPIEVGAMTTYSIRVKNQGTKDAGNIQFVALIPPGMKPITATGPTKYRVEGDRIYFDSISRLPPKGESTYNIRVQGVAAGDQRFRVQMTSDDMSAPVVEEESTKVYAD